MKKTHVGLTAALAVALSGFALHGQPSVTQPPPAKSNFQFIFVPGKILPGSIQLTPDDIYTRERGHGFDFGAKLKALDSGVSSDQPFFFSVDLPEGNYDVRLRLGNPGGDTINSVKAESRRLMLENVKVPAGKLETRTFTTNIRNSKLAGGGQVKLKDREMKGPHGGYVLHWDDKLTLEFAGKSPCVAAISITRNDSAITVYLAGDSTVTDQTTGAFYSWGQILPRFFKPGGVAIANHAESGEATTSFIGAKRLEKILNTLKKGDYLFIQFGHNDQNQKREVGVYKDTLKRYVAEARKRDAIPVLLTPMHRRQFDAGGKVRNSLAGFPDAVRQLAKEEKVMLIDLHAMSAEFYESLGPDKSKSAFVDNTHTNDYGAYEFARFIAETIKNSDLGLAKHVVGDLPARNFKGPKGGN